MKNTRSIATFFLVVFASWLVGCMSYQKEVISEQRQICGNTNKVLNASLLSGENVIFNSDGGRITHYSLSVRGKFSTGKLVIQSILDIKQIYSGNPPHVQPMDALVKDRSIKITQIDLRNGTSILFDSTGGKLVDEAIALKGLSEDNALYQLEPELINQMTVETVDLLPTILSTGGIIVLILLTVAVIAIAAAPAPNIHFPTNWKF